MRVRVRVSAAGRAAVVGSGGGALARELPRGNAKVPRRDDSVEGGVTLPPPTLSQYCESGEGEGTLHYYRGGPLLGMSELLNRRSLSALANGTAVHCWHCALFTVQGCCSSSCSSLSISSTRFRHCYSRQAIAPEWCRRPWVRPSRPARSPSSGAVDGTRLFRRSLSGSFALWSLRPEAAARRCCWLSSRVPGPCTCS